MMAWILSTLIAIAVVIGGFVMLSSASKSYVEKHPELREQAQKDLEEKEKESKRIDQFQHLLKNQ